MREERTDSGRQNGGRTPSGAQTCPVKGVHPVVRMIVGTAERLADGDVSVFIVGERGSGRELLARYLHHVGRGDDAPFVRIDCSEASTTRLERELFEAGGGLARAAGGTLFLDDLGALPLDMQDQLLAARRGAARVARVVASCAADAANECRLGRVSEGLLRQLAPVELVMPSLRQRRADILLLVEHFLDLYVARHGVPSCRIENDALVNIWQYDWPGNVRELESVIERVVVLCRSGVVRTADLPPHVRLGGAAHRPTAPASTRFSAPHAAGPTLRPLSS